MMLLLVAGLTLTLFACSSEERLHDLHVYMEHLKKAIIKHAKKNYVAEINQPAPAVFQTAGKHRDPFVDEQASYAGLASTDPLEAYPVKEFEFIGTVEGDKKTWGIIKGPDDKIYQLGVGDRIGNHYGRIVNIYSDHMEVEEPIVEAPGQKGYKKIVDLPLKGKT
jgi:type IV pilus assembly protein PilP